MTKSRATDMEYDGLSWLRGIDRITGSDGILVGFAFDHRNSISKEMDSHGMPSDTASIQRFKREVIGALAPYATLVLLDPDFGLAAVEGGDLPGDVAFAMPLEAPRAQGAPFHAPTRLMDAWTADRARRVGADACKLLLPLRMDMPSHAKEQLDTCRRAIDACHRAGVVPIIEPVVWPDGELAAESPAFGALVVAGAQQVSALGTVVLKVQHPGDAFLDRLASACAPNPWVLLGGGASAKELRDEVRSASRAGASGFLVGRTLFRPALVVDPVERGAVLRDVSVPLLVELAGVCREVGRPMRRRVET